MGSMRFYLNIKLMNFLTCNNQIYWDIFHFYYALSVALILSNTLSISSTELIFTISPANSM